MKLNRDILFLFFFLFTSHFINAQNDFVTLANNKTIEGTINGMKNGVLNFKYSNSNFKIDWNDIKRLESNRTFIFTLTTGEYYKGSFKTDTTNNTSISIFNKGKFYVFNKDFVVEITPIEKSFLNKWKGSIAAGYTLTKSNKNQQFNTSANLSYLSEVSNLNTSASVIRNYLNDSITTNRSEFNLNYKYFVTNRVFTQIGINLLQNEEQKLNLRFTGQGGIGRFLIRSQNSYFSTFIGIAWNNESYSTPETPKKNSAEGWVGIDLSFKPSKGINFSLNGNAYPGITVQERIRANLESAIDFNLIWGLKFRVSYKYNFDSHPPSKAVKHDYVLITALSWGF